ncbi:MAG: hypothetical protein IT178_18490 [Acidobacteria bacterium]|nr:hypothetical protein [Acidobacteriota bacterium]
MSPASFAAALADRLAAILPAGFGARAEGDAVYVDSPEGLGAATSLSQIDPDEADAQDYADAAWNVLSMAQDVVSETRGEPWPAAVGADVADPGSDATDGEVRLWFGPAGQPVLTLPPISME